MTHRFRLPLPSASRQPPDPAWLTLNNVTVARDPSCREGGPPCRPAAGFIAGCVSDTLSIRQPALYSAQPFVDVPRLRRSECQALSSAIQSSFSAGRQMGALGGTGCSEIRSLEHYSPLPGVCVPLIPMPLTALLTRDGVRAHRVRSLCL